MSLQVGLTAMALVRSPNKLRVTKSLGEFPHLSYPMTWFISVTKKSVHPPCSADGQLPWHQGAEKEKWRLLYSATRWRMNSWCWKNPELLHGLQIRCFIEQKSWLMMNKGFSVVGCVDWSVLVQTSAISFIQLMEVSRPGLCDYGQVVLNRRRVCKTSQGCESVTLS